MAIDLAELILEVQTSLSDLPDNYCNDEAIFKELETSQEYIGSIKRTTYSDESFEKKGIARLAAYFVYVNYTSLAERQMGTIPQATIIKTDVLRRIALAFIRQMSDLTIDDDLSVSTKREEKSYPVAAVNTNSVFTE